MRLRIRYGAHVPPARFTRTDAYSHSPKATRKHPLYGLPNALAPTSPTRWRDQTTVATDGSSDAVVAPDRHAVTGVEAITTEERQGRQSAVR